MSLLFCEGVCCTVCIIAPLVSSGGVGVRWLSLLVGFSVVLPARGLPCWLALVGFGPLLDAWLGAGLLVG